MTLEWITVRSDTLVDALVEEFDPSMAALQSFARRIGVSLVVECKPSPPEAAS